MRKSLILSFIFALLLVFSATSAFAEGDTTTSEITPFYEPCPVWGSSHQYVYTGYSWVDENIFRYEHEHEIIGSDGTPVYEYCHVYSDRLNKSYICECGARKTTYTWQNTRHILQ